MPSAVRFGRAAAIVALAAGYAFLAHYTNVVRAERIGTAIALAPLVLAAVSFAWHSPRRSAMLALCLLGFGALLAAWPALERHFSLIYWVEHAGTELLLCLAFGRTLAPGREPMCTYFARMVHGTLAPPVERYTRQITRAWVVFFAGMAAASTALFFAAPLAIWSAFANFFTAPLIIMMFAGEYFVRRRLHPDMEHASILAGIQAFWKSPARQ